MRMETTTNDRQRRASPGLLQETRKDRELVAAQSPRAKQPMSRRQTTSHTISSKPQNQGSRARHRAIRHTDQVRYEASGNPRAAMATRRHPVCKTRHPELPRKSPSSQHPFMTSPASTGRTRAFPPKPLHLCPLLQLRHRLPRPHLPWISMRYRALTTSCKMADCHTLCLAIFCPCYPYRTARVVRNLRCPAPTRSSRHSSICSTSTAQSLKSKDPLLLRLDIDQSLEGYSIA